MTEGFHSHDEFFWLRMVDGSVRVRIYGDEGYGGPFIEHVMDPSTWASVVASVTPQGDTADTFREAQRLHLNGVQPFQFDQGRERDAFIDGWIWAARVSRGK